MISNLEVSNWIVQRLIQNGINHFVISPGSRSTPLAVAVARNPNASSTIHFDERGAAYFALGHGKASTHPAVLICTSGTAVANYFPAVIEASMDEIPLIILTADRPPELIGVGANQAIFQENIYGSYPRLFKNLSPPNNRTTRDFVRSEVDQLIEASAGSRPGPVHLNCQFREPLLAANRSIVLDEPAQSDNTNEILKVSAHIPSHQDKSESMQQLFSQINSAQKVLIVVGRSIPADHLDAVLALSERYDWPIFPDIQSGLRFKIHPNIINYFDVTLLRNDIKNSLPEVVIHLGGSFTSKRLLEYLNDPHIYYLSAKSSSEPSDPNHQVDVEIQVGLDHFCNSLLGADLSSGPAYKDSWKKASFVSAAIVRDKLLALDGITESGISFLLSQNIPATYNLMLANSMAIREMEMFGLPGSFEGAVTANRGSSGIDGLFATAAGFQNGSQKPLVLLIGDLAALHDINSLSLIKQAQGPIIIIIVNNRGGGIFNFLPVKNETDVFETYFGTPHDLNFESAANMYGIGYAKPQNIATFLDELRKCGENSTTKIIELATDRYENHKHHLELFASIRDA